MAPVLTFLDQLTIEPVDVDLPEACASCGQDFTEPDSLVEVGYMATRRTCRVVTENGTAFIGEHERTECTDELAIATGYVCGGCQKVIALAAPLHRASPERLGGAPPAPSLDGMIHPPAESAILSSLRSAIRKVRARGVAVRIGALGLLDAGRDGWEIAPHGDGISPVGAAILDAQPQVGIEWEQAAAMALGCDLAALEGLQDGLDRKDPSGVWGRSIAKDNYRAGFLAGVELRADLLAPAGALRVVS